MTLTNHQSGHMKRMRFGRVARMIGEMNMPIGMPMEGWWWSPWDDLDDGASKT